MLAVFLVRVTNYLRFVDNIFRFLTIIRSEIFQLYASPWSYAPRTQCDTLVQSADVCSSLSFRVRERLRQLVVHVSTLEA
jgi:hypothetical protein